jgi:outer membrane protein TolC
MDRFILIILLFTSLVTRGQVKLNSLQECLDYTRQHNPAIRSEKLNAEISKQKLKAAWANFFPQLKATGAIDDNISLPVQLVPAEFLGGEPGQFAKVKFGTQYTASFGAEANLSLVNISNWKGVSAAEMQVEASRYQQLDKEENVLEQVIVAYYYALLSREAMRLNRELVLANDSLLRITREAFHQGTKESLEVNRVQSLYLESQDQFEESASSYQKNIQGLKNLLGMNEGDSLVLTEQVKNENALTSQPSSLDIQADKTLRYRSLYYRELQSRDEWKKQRSKIFPELSLYGRYTRQAFRQTFNFFSSNDAWYNVGVIGLRAEWVLFNGFGRQANIKQSSLQHEIAALDQEAYQSQAVKELEELKINHQRTYSGLLNAIDHFSINRENYAIAQVKYQQGVYTLDQYINIYQELVRSQNQYVNKLANYLIYESIVQTKNEYNQK